MKYKNLCLLCGLILLAACSPAAESVRPTAEVAAVEATAMVVPTSTAPTVASPATPAADDEPPSVVAGQSSTVIYGRNDDGTFFHGAPDAPVTFIDYSDFL